MIRVALKPADAPPRVLSEEEFIREIAELAAAGFTGAKPGPVSVEALEPDGRVSWRAYYTSIERLAEMAEELVRDRIATRGG